jgi:asparagine synthase (glutamine-hydrolysing)
MGDTNLADYSHLIRWRTTRRAKRFFSDELRLAVETQAIRERQALIYPDGFSNWDPLSRAQYIEATVFLSQYLLSSQGDRMAMAHSVEGRYPFLDYRVIEFCNRLPAELKLFGLREKYLLKKMAQEWLPKEILQRPKRPYRAPIHRSFFSNGATPEYVFDLLSPRKIEETRLFNSGAVSQMVQKLVDGKRLGETDDMALAGILSSQLVHEQFVTGFRRSSPVSEDDRVKICRGNVPYR